MQKNYIVALDQRTAGSRCVIFDREQRVLAAVKKPVARYAPQPGFVEHAPMELFTSQQSALFEALANTGISPEEVAAIGIANQRETTVVWEKSTGRPVYNAISWQCRRTEPLCRELREDREMAAYIREQTGLPIDACFSATKIRWILDNVPGTLRRAQAGELLFGTVDAWLTWKLTGGRIHATDYTNASRTMLYNIRELRWDEKICGWLGIPLAMLPEVRGAGGVLGAVSVRGVEIPIAARAGNQQAVLFGQGCVSEGQAAGSYENDVFLLMNTGGRMYTSTHGLLTTIALGPDGQARYAMEGRVPVGGSVLAWLRDGLRLLEDPEDAEYFAGRVEDSGGVYLVPAFQGLGAPHWDAGARGAILGLTPDTRRSHIIRAALEGIAYQVHDLLDAMTRDTNIRLRELWADGETSANRFLMQYQADVLGAEVIRPENPEVTALGIAGLAGLAVGFWKGREDLSARRCPALRCLPGLPREIAAGRLAQWGRAVGSVRGWLPPE